MDANMGIGQGCFFLLFFLYDGRIIYWVYITALANEYTTLLLKEMQILAPTAAQLSEGLTDFYIK